MKKKMMIFCLLILVISINAKDYTCGNGICNSNENHFSCEIDCDSGIKDNYCDNIKDSICDPDCINTDPDCPDFGKQINFEEQKDNKALGYIFLISSIIAIIIVLIIIFKKIADEKIEQDKKIYSVKNIKRFSNIKEKKENSWTKKSDSEILNEIKKDEKYKKYFTK
jgi:hypothetical protein